LPPQLRTQAEIARALYGNWRAEHLFVLQQAVTLYDFYREQLRVCDDQIPTNCPPLPPFVSSIVAEVL
jgi:hypothetical protein